MKRLYDATLMYYLSEKEKSLAHLEILFKNPCGIGEHSDILEEIKKWVEVGVNADDCINFLKTEFHIAEEIEKQKNK
jgi:hypothetical protein